MFKYFAVLLILLNTKTCNREMSKEDQSVESQEKIMIVQEPAQQLHDIWVLKSMLDEDIKEEMFPGGSPNLEILLADRSIAGFGGCNRYFSDITEIDEEKIKFGVIAATKMYCMNVAESTYLELLAKSNRYKIEKLHLYLYQDEQVLLCFRKVD